MVVTVSEILILSYLNESNKPKQLSEIAENVKKCGISYSDTYVKLRQLGFEGKVTAKRYGGYSLTDLGYETLGIQLRLLQPLFKKKNPICINIGTVNCPDGSTWQPDSYKKKASFGGK